MKRLIRHLPILLLFLGLGQPVRGQAALPRPQVLVQAEAADSLLARDVKGIAERSLMSYPQGELSPDRSPIKILLATDRESFQKMARGRSPEWAAGIVLERGRTILIEKNYLLDRVQAQHLVRHEIAHVILDRQLRGRPVPHWFHEGFAQVHAGEWDMNRLWRLARAAWTKTAIPLTELRRGFPYSGARAQLAYAQSQAAVQDLRRDSEPWLHLLELLYQELPFDEALERSQGRNLAAFEEYFDRDLMPSYRRWSLLFSAAPLFFFMMLLFLFAAWRRWRRRRAGGKAGELPTEEWYAKGWIDKQWPG